MVDSQGIIVMIYDVKRLSLSGTSLVVQWLRLHLLMQGVKV